MKQKTKAITKLCVWAADVMKAEDFTSFFGVWGCAQGVFSNMARGGLLLSGSIDESLLSLFIIFAMWPNSLISVADTRDPALSPVHARTPCSQRQLQHTQIVCLWSFACILDFICTCLLYMFQPSAAVTAFSAYLFFLFIFLSVSLMFSFWLYCPSDRS